MVWEVFNHVEACRKHRFDRSWPARGGGPVAGDWRRRPMMDERIAGAS